MATTGTSPRTVSGGVAAVRQRTVRQARELWRRPTVVVARSLLAAYVGSGWVLLEALALAALFLFAFPRADGPQHFFEASYAILGVTAVLGALLTLARTTLARTDDPGVYAPLIERHGAAACARGLALALAASRLCSYLVLLALVALTGRLTGASFGGMLAGSLGLVPTITLIALVTVALCPPFAGPNQRVGFLLWLSAALFSYAGDNVLAHLCVVTRLPLLPVGALFASGITGGLGWGGLLALVLVAGYLYGLTRLFAWRLEAEGTRVGNMAATVPVGNKVEGDPS